MLYLVVAAILAVETTGISFLKEFSLDHHPLNLLSGILLYTVVTFLLVKSFQYESMGIVNVLWSAFSVLLVVAVDVLYFGEKLRTMEVIGIVMIVSGVMVLGRFDSL